MHLINPMDTLPKTGRVYVEYSGNKYNGYARGITPIAISNEYAHIWADPRTTDKRGKALAWGYDVTEATLCT